jgi:hypothetical protein
VFVKLVLVVQNELWQTTSDEAIINVDGEDGCVVVDVGGENSRIVADDSSLRQAKDVELKGM